MASGPYAVPPSLVVMSTEVRAAGVVDRPEGAAAALPRIFHRLCQRCQLGVAQRVASLPKCWPMRRILS